MRIPRLQDLRTAVIFAVLALALPLAPAAAKPLPSWNDGANKQAIVGVVAAPQSAGATQVGEAAFGDRGGDVFKLSYASAFGHGTFRCWAA